MTHVDSDDLELVPPHWPVDAEGAWAVAGADEDKEDEEDADDEDNGGDPRVEALVP